MRAFLAALLLLPALVLSQDKAETRELVGTLGSRTVLVVTRAMQGADGGWRITGEYVVLPTLSRRFLEGERGPELGVTVLKEGTSAILFGHDATGELRGTWRGGVLKGTRYGPGGQERERFEFSEHFPSMADYSASVRCEVGEGSSRARLAFVAQNGKVSGFEWSSAHGCTLSGLEQQAFEGGLRLARGRCAVTFRQVGDVVKVAAEGCAEHCGAQASSEPVLVERRGSCRLLRPEAR